MTGVLSGSLYDFATLDEHLAQGQIPVWNFFDEGNYPGGRIKYTVAINSNSPYQDAAWTALEYLLNGDMQSAAAFSYRLFPVKRSGFDELIRKEMEEGSLLYSVSSDGTPNSIYAKAGLEGYKNSFAAVQDYENYRAMHDITEEKAEQFLQMMESARTMPVRNQEILNIVIEEAAAYFADAKSLDEVCRLSQNRAQLYLDEKK